MTERPDHLSDLSPSEKRRLLAQLLREKAQASQAGPSYGQRALWLLNRLDPESASYNVPWTWWIRSEVDVPALRSAFQALVDRHRVLRTTYVEANGQPTLRVHDSVTVDFEDLAAASWTDDELNHRISHEAHRPFDLEHGPVLRVRVFTRSPQASVLLVTLHHIAYDLWSMMTLLNELGIFYQAAREQRVAELPPAHSYEAFAQWQAGMLAGAEGDRLWNYWKAQLGGDIPVLSLPIDRPRPAVQTSSGATYAVRIPEDLGRRLRELAQSQGHTLFTVLLSAFEALLARYSGESDIVVGSPMTGRTRPEFQDVVGYCLNTVPLRGDLSGDPTFVELLRRMRQTVLGALEHQDYPFALLVEKLRPKRDPSHGTLLHALFALNKPHKRDDQSLSLSMDEGAGQMELGGLSLEFTQVAQQAVVDDLVLLMSEIDDSLGCRWQYNTDLFDESTIARMAAHYERLLESIAANPQARISELAMMTASERTQVVTTWNATARPYPAGSIAEVFAAQAAQRPTEVAVVAGGLSLSYGELNARANQLAHFLIDAGVGADVLVGLFAERTLDMVVGLLGILKAGGAYLPLDPSYPKDRLAFMMEDARVPVLLTEAKLLDALPAHHARVVRLDADWPEIAERSTANPPPRSTADHLAYVTYTSGSTGIPKGVEIRQRGVTRLLFGVDYVRLDSSQRFLQLAPVTFDASTLEIWGALLHGGTLALFTERAPTPQALEQILAREKTTVLWLTASLFNSIVDARPEALSGVRQLLIGGEALSVAHVKRAQAALPATQIINGYGPTESTTFTCCYPIPRIGSAEPASIPIGGPIANTQVYVLDPRLEPVPIGVTGELYIGGDGLGRGYMNRPALTAERFVPNPFSDRKDARLYKTGDLVRWRPDGTIAFLGRVDSQVKIRGFRIEPGEIEAVLKQHPAVREALVDVRELPVAGRSLVAYVVPNVVTTGAESADANEVTMNGVRDHLRDRLPDYMVPSVWVVLDALPLTPNGKVDRAALPAPEGSGLEQEFVAPSEGLEAQIARVWQDVLQIERVGTRDSFFDLGGHSLLLVQAQAKLVAALGRDVPIVDLFRFPTVESLARHLAPQKPADPGASRSSRLSERVARRRAPAARDEAIAIIGMAGRFPGAPDLPTFWRNLHGGVESIRFFTVDELRDAGIDERLLADPKYVRARAVMDGVDLFDAAFFGYSPREAEVIDPQQRLFLECASEALDRAGYDPDRYDGAVGVYGGAITNGYLLNVLSQPGFSLSTSGLQALIGGGPDFLTTRVSYKLNLRGPSVTVQTACSTSLVAIHHACRSLIEHECDMALAGGVSVGVPVFGGHVHQEGGILSPDGHCRAFDANARGTVTGHGVGIVVLKRLADAVADGDTIHAVIRGTAINNDGSAKVGYTAPSVEGQAEVIALAQATAGVEPESISYVEAHGTGTALGDPIELTALTEAFGTASEQGTCAIGSLKTNIGHLDAAAGVASLIKTVLALEHGEIPPSLHFDTPNPKIDFSRTPFFVNAAVTPWVTRDGGPRRAGVSSFGIGGTNAHAVLEQAPPAAVSSASRPWQLLVLSARTRTALEAACSELSAYLTSEPAAFAPARFADVAYTLGLGRRIFAHRRVIVSRDAAEAAQALSQPDRSGLAAVVEPGERSCVFMFSGQGAQYAGMARELYEGEPSFRADVDACCDSLEPHLGWDLRAVLTAAPTQETAARLRQTSVTQPALFVVEYSLARLWMRWGIRPAALIGHSIGELVAACLAGVFSLEDALALVAARGRLMQALPSGAMAAVGLTEAELTPLLANTGLSLAAVNGPALCVVAGADADVTAFETRVSARGTLVRRLETSHAFHSAMMEPALEAFGAAVASVARHAPSIPFISNVTGTWISDAEATSAEYWTQHLRQPVRFSAGIQELLQDSTRVFLEVGPGRTLASLVRQQGALAQGRSIATTLRHPQETIADLPNLLQTLGKLWLSGLNIDWAGLYAGESRRRVPLPTYPFQRKRHWIDVRPSGVRQGQALRKSDLGDWFYVPSWRQTLPPASETQASASAPWLLFADQAGVATGVATYLRQRGQDVVVVEAGDRFAAQTGGSYTVDPGNGDDYRELLGQLRVAGRFPGVIAHFWGVTRETPADSADSGLCQQRGFESLLLLAQAIGQAGSSAPLRLAVVTSDLHLVSGDEALCPSKATVLGPCRVIPAEYPHVSCRALDLVASEWTQAADAEVGRLVQEITAETADIVAACRRGQWWAQAADPVRFEAVAGNEPTRLRDGGVYLVTGGLGGVGLTLAGHLARSVKANLVLTGRRALPDRAEWASHVAANGRMSQQIRAVESLERAGATVSVLAADVSDAEQTQAVVQHALQRFGRLDGVIHAAGVPGGGVIQLKTAGMASQVLAPKVAGTQALSRALAGLDLDFFALCSSLTSLVGGGGQVDYCAANAYLDAFAAHHSRQSGRFTVAINWDAWRDVGMAAETAVPGGMARERAAVLKHGISPDEGVEAFVRILARSTSPQIVVSTVPLSALADRLPGKDDVPSAAGAAAGAHAELAEAVSSIQRHERPELAIDYVAPVSEIERRIADVWQELLGIEHVGREDNFFDLGGHSLLLVQMHAALSKKLDRALAITDLFQFPTIHSLADHVAGPKDVQPPPVEAMGSQQGPAASAVAIVGMSGRFPGAPDLDRFWANLRDGIEAIEPVSDEELRQHDVDEDLLKNPRYVKAASTLDAIDLFDAGFFGYSPREAELIDPQQRVFLECVWEALEHAGYDPRACGGQMGVWAGSSANSYFSNIFSHPDLVQSVGIMQAMMGTRSDYLPTRVSYKLNLRGPSINVQTACSTSLVAVHQACRSLVDRECRIALAGGVCITGSVTGKTGYLYQDEGILSPDGHCRAFDARAQGTVWGDGVGVVVLKRLEDALADGDTIHAVIRGTAINNDGAVKVGFTAPSVEGQAAVVARAQAVAGVDAASITYIEAHGTGTTLGDPIEIAALRQVFGSGEPGTCAIGTLKTNIGHLDAAAGIAGLIKTTLALEHGELPPSLHFDSPNPKIPFADSPFFVNATLRPWTSAGAPRRAGVSAFGIGGTNAHAVLEEAPALAETSASRPWQVVVLSARTPAALDAATARLAGYLTSAAAAPLSDVAYTLQVGRRAFAHRRILVCRDAGAAAAALASADRAPVFTSAADTVDRSCTFLFSGQGSQYASMARGLYQDEAAFRDDVDECCRLLAPHVGRDLRELLHAESGTPEAALLRETQFTQPALFVVEYALARMWMRWGIQPSAMLGHSIGEYVAACLAGVFSLEDALALVATRGRLMQTLPAGAMLAVPLPEAEVLPLLGDTLSLAAVNGPAFCVASGPDAAIDDLETRLTARGVAARRLETSHAFHSAMMAPILDAFAEAVARVPRKAPRIPFVSNVTGTWITAAEATAPDYWTRHLRQAVRFSAGVQELLKDTSRVFVEVGPGRTLATLVRQQGQPAQGRTILTSLRHPQETGDDLSFVLQTLGRLWLAGVPVDWPAFSASERRRRVPLPTYPFERQRFWIESRKEERQAAGPRVLAKNADVASWFYSLSWTPAQHGRRQAVDGAPWLVFADEGSSGDLLAAKLGRAGAPVVLVRAGSRFLAQAPGVYVIDPGDPGQYDALLAALADTDRFPRRIVHAWSLGSAAVTERQDDAFARAQDRGFYSVLFLVQALARRGKGEALDITIAGDQLRTIEAGDLVNPDKTPILGLSLVIPQEFPHIRCATIDLEPLEPTTGAADSADLLKAELLSQPGATTVAYRGGRRLIQSPAPMTLAEPSGRTALRERGVYLITGGLGHIGLAIAERLARDVAARLVLVGRSAPPSREAWPALLETPGADPRTLAQITAVQHLESLGAEVLVVAADASNLDQMRALVTHTIGRFGALHGVFHAAGTLREGFDMLPALTRDACERQFRPKVAGVRALDEATADLALDFCLLTSSLSAVLGGLGHGAYAAANQFLDAFAEQRAISGGRRWISVNLDGWTFVHGGPSSATGVLEMQPAEGVESLIRILRDESVTRVAVSTGDLDARLDRYVRRTSAPVAAAVTVPVPAASRYARPDLGTDYVAPTDDFERVIAEVWQDALGIASIGRDDNFFDLGGHSLMLVQVHATLVEKLGRTLSVTDLFEHSTIATLAAHLGGNRRAAPVVHLAERPVGATPNAIAIVGMSGRFPGAPDLPTFWANLRNGVESIERLDDDELRRQGVDESLLQNPQYVRAASTLDGIDLFDAGFFGYSPREAELIDPQHRLFLECAWEALEQAGCDPKQYPGQIGVYAGTNFGWYLANVLSNPEIVEAMGTLHAGLGSRGDHLPTRVSYKLSLRGPSLNVQTSCSTSLVAIHQACRSLVDGECDMALAGGVSIVVGLAGKTGYLYQDDGILSPDGHCRAFDAQGQGTVWGDGVGVVVLKRLDDAIAEGDTIHAVIRGTAINNDGSAKVGYTAPSVEGQAAVVARALAVAGVAPSEVSYIEAHGTATTLGDPIEMSALGQVFQSVAPNTCAIGTVKSNVGHLESAAGVAGLIKAVLALEHGELPPSLHFKTPNPKIDFASSPFFVNAQLRPWDANGAPRRAGVSSFGIGGTNAHAVLEEAPPQPEPSPSREWQLVTVSARSVGALEEVTERLAAHLDENPGASLPDVAHTLHVGRRSFAHRRFVVCRETTEAARALREAGHNATSTVEPGDRAPVFMFSGQGAQYPGMARELYRDEPAFRADIDACCDRLAGSLGLDLRSVLFASDGSEEEAGARLTGTRLAQPALFVVEYALARMWMRWGLRPAALIGHSIGEYVAACLSGVFSLEDALTLVAERGRLMQTLPAGAMLAVPLGEDELQPLLGAELSIAAVNGPALCVASGPSEAIGALEARLTAGGVAARRLETSHAFHSAMMDPVLDAFASAVERTERRAPRIPFVSNLTGTWITAAEATDPQYWVRHLRQTVRFSAGTQELLKDPARIFVEVGPGRTLASLVRQQPAARGRTVLTSLRHPQETRADLPLVLDTLGRLWLAGVQVDWHAFNADESRRRVPLPTYPFERSRYWITARTLTAVDGPLQLERAELSDWFYIPSWKRSMASSPRRSFAEALPRRWVLFADAEGLADRIAAFLEEAGREVVVVEAGKQFERLSGQRYVIDPGDAGHYKQLLNAIAGAGMPDVIGHFWGYTSETPVEPRDSAVCQERGFSSLLSLAQALGEMGASSPISLAVVTSDLHDVTGDEVLCPSKATVLGPCRVIPYEYPHVTCRAVDLVASEWLLADNTQIEGLVTEMVSGASISAYRRGRRWLESIEATRLDEVPGDGPVRLQQHGVYLITGGLGGVGLTLAEYLARAVGARLVLTGRHGLPDKTEWAKYVASHGDDDRTSRQIHVVDALERAGAEVMVAAVDVSNVAQMRALVEDIRRKYGRLDGVIHAAGVPGGGVIQLKTTEAAAQVLAPKVGGTQAVSQAVAGVDLDFFILCSSSISIFGGGGQVDYCAANAYLDAFAHEYTRRTGTYTVAINWDAWQGVGMAVNTAAGISGQIAREREELLRRGIRPDEGVEAFRRILTHCTIPQIVVSTTSLEPYIRKTRGPAKPAVAAAAVSRHARPELATSFAAPDGEIEEAIAEVWKELLGISQVGRHDNFFDLGGHSLLATQLTSRLKGELGIALRLASVFAAPTVAGMAELLLEQMLAEQGTEVQDELLDEVQGRKPS